MNIGLLVTEIEDKEVKKICIGAIKAAKDKDANLVIIPGRYLISDGSGAELLYEYQYPALFDYAISSDFDALIVDIDRIGSKTTILKREAFLKKFSNNTLLLLSEHDGYVSVNTPETETTQFEQLGYEAVSDAVFYVKNQVLPSLEAPQNFNFEEESEAHALSVLSDVSNLLFHRKYDSEKAYSFFTNTALQYGVKNNAILIYDKKEKNNIKYPWQRPDHIIIKSAVMDGKEMELNDGKIGLSTDKIISTFARGESKTFILGDIYVGEYQLGLMITEYFPAILIDHYFDTITNLVTGVSRLAYLERQLEKTTEELYEVQEELARDDSVLDHIGDQDYLTGCLNRRGFFAKAYDLLKDEFVPGKNALVAYIHMESLKRINDMFGHDEGDRAVKRVSQILEDVFGDSIYGRIRGDEFAVLVITDEDGKAEALREKMSEQNTKLLTEANRYINHLQYTICEFSYEDNLSLREMLKETDENLKRLKGNV